MKRSRIPRRSPLRKGKRKPSETLRVYGPATRRAWIRSLPCIVPNCHRFWDIQNMHIEGGGVGRKADYDKIVPCCSQHHRYAHTAGIESFARFFNIDLELAAIATEQQWLAHLARA